MNGQVFNNRIAISFNGKFQSTEVETRIDDEFIAQSFKCTIDGEPVKIYRKLRRVDREKKALLPDGYWFGVWVNDANGDEFEFDLHSGELKRTFKATR